MHTSRLSAAPQRFVTVQTAFATSPASKYHSGEYYPLPKEFRPIGAGKKEWVGGAPEGAGPAFLRQGKPESGLYALRKQILGEEFVRLPEGNEKVLKRERDTKKKGRIPKNAAFGNEMRMETKSGLGLRSRRNRIFRFFSWLSLLGLGSRFTGSFRGRFASLRGCLRLLWLDGEKFDVED